MSSSSINIYYSYNQKDNRYREQMETFLTTLSRSKIIKEWSDKEIIAGQEIGEKKIAALNNADVIVFLISVDFLNSPQCVDEWNRAKQISKDGNKRLVSIIVRDCPWEDFDDLKDYLSLPKINGPVSSWTDSDSAWTHIYGEIKKVVLSIRNDFTIRDSFAKQISTMEFCSTSSDVLFIDDFFVFPNLKKFNDTDEREDTVASVTEILKKPHTIIQGEFQSGKTSLATHIFLEQLKKSTYSLFVDLQEIAGKKPNKDHFREIYQREFNGDFDLWMDKKGKCIIFDNLTHNGNALDHIIFSEDFFETIIIMCSIEEYESFFTDDKRLTDYVVLTIRPFTHSKQEKLIRNWLSYKNKNSDSAIDLGKVDILENNINSIVINNRILPRYPFFILSILQTHEAFMPQDVKITAYGHCYYALIMAHLIKSGISKDDNSITSCLNFASHLAYAIHSNGSGNLYISKDDYEDFKVKYKEEFIIQDALINRMQSQYGIIKDCNGSGYKFSLPYSYYYFLGQFLSENYKSHKNIILDMIENNYIKNNSLVIIFTIHHSNDIEIIDEVLTYTMCAHDDFKPATLNANELKIFNDLLYWIPELISNNGSVDALREEERNRRDVHEIRHEEDNEVAVEKQVQDEPAKEQSKKFINQIYQCYKNIEILSQILKNKFGSLRKDKVAEIVEIVCDAGLRLAGLYMSKDVSVEELIVYIHKAYMESEDYDEKKSKEEHLTEIRRQIVLRIFLWVMMNLEKTVSAINKPEICEIVKNVKDDKKTPSYDLIYYFYTLDTALNFDDSMKEQLDYLIEKYKDKEVEFLRRVLSIRTQYYLNTHNVRTQMRQSVSSSLGIEYKPKPLEL